MDAAPCFACDRIMTEGPSISRVAALTGDPARANIPVALMRGHLVTAAEGMTLSPAGRDVAAGFGIAPEDFAGVRPPHCRECLDRSARRASAPSRGPSRKVGFNPPWLWWNNGRPPGDESLDAARQWP